MNASPDRQDGDADEASALETSSRAVLEEFEAESPVRTLSGPALVAVRWLSVGLSLYALYWVVGIIEPQIYRASFLLVTLVLSFLVYPLNRASRDRVGTVDWLLAGASVIALGWPLVDLREFIYRAATPLPIDLLLGTLAILLVLEATRRTVGSILPVTAIGFIAYAYYGPLFDLIGWSLIGHRGYALDRLVGTLYMTLEGIFGVPLDVAATYIILFTIFGAILEHSGAGSFFLRWAMAAMGRSRSSSGAGRTVAVAGFLLGTVSGSGVATTVMLGAVAWPMLRRSGYSKDVGAAVLSAAGIGAILAPPSMGAAAFLIAEFLKISYLQVLMMAIVPAILYYVSIFLMIEADSKRSGTTAPDMPTISLWNLTRTYGYHFTSLFTIAALMISGMTAFRAVFWAIALATALSFIRSETALRPRRLLAALEAGGRGVLPIAATTATAGIIVGVVTLTGLGLKIAGIIVTLAGGSLLLTVIYAAFAVWLLGLAVPVTASYIIAAVMIAPALIQVGVPEVAAHMFIFFYAVLSEVSPPTALSPFAAAALTGGNPFRTMMLTWKYTLPAFLVPFVFTLSPQGMGVLLQAPPLDIVWVIVTATTGVGALAMGLGGWMIGAANMPERIVATVGGTLLFYASPATDAAGLALFAVAAVAHVSRRRRLQTA